MDGLIRLPHVNFRTASIGALCCLGSLTNWANDAELTIACQSIAVYPATADDAVGSTYEGSFTSDFSDDGELISINHEWFPVSGTVGYASGLQLVDTLFEITYLAIVEADIPLSGDSNLNFITDFFEVDREVSAETSGSIDFGAGPEPVAASWSRAAGQTSGILRLSFASPSPVGDGLTFEHTFEVFQYRGAVRYTPASEIGGSVAATVDLKRVGTEGEFKGNLPMRAVDVRSLEREATQWTAADGTVFDVLGTFEVEGVELFLDRLPNRPSYVGSFFFLDGVPGTPFQDEYDLWDAFLRDPNDADGDGIPDLTDPAGAVISEPPVLSLRTEGQNLVIQLTGKVGTTVQLEQRSGLNSGSWSSVQSVTFSQATETVVVASPATDTFYRATAP